MRRPLVSETSMAIQRSDRISSLCPPWQHKHTKKGGTNTTRLTSDTSNVARRSPFPVPSVFHHIISPATPDDKGVHIEYHGPGPTTASKGPQNLAALRLPTRGASNPSCSKTLLPPASRPAIAPTPRSATHHQRNHAIPNVAKAIGIVVSNNGQ